MGIKFIPFNMKYNIPNPIDLFNHKLYLPKTLTNCYYYCQATILSIKTYKVNIAMHNY